MSLLIIILALLPGFTWLFFYTREDPHPEPKGLLLHAFINGAAFAFVALAAQEIFKDLGWLIDPVAPLASLITPQKFLVAIIGMALIEEVAKFAAAYFAVHKKPEFDEPIDAMIYMVVAALGFATMENLGALIPESKALFNVHVALQTISLRFVGATLLHALTAGVIGYYWALDIRNFGNKKLLLWGIILATVLHAVFNYFIIAFGDITYSLVFLVVVGLFVLNDFEKLRQRAV